MRKNDKIVKALALFWRYGFWLMMMAAMYPSVIFFRIHPYLTVSAFMLVDGIYTIIITAFSCEHFICGMQNAYHQKMTPYRHHKRGWLNKIKREGYFIGVFFSVLGLTLLIIYILDL